MIVTAWILFIIFGLIIIAYFDNGNWEGVKDYIFFTFSAIIVALSAGVIWGGLFNF
jgi:hypothetical protein